MQSCLRVLKPLHTVERSKLVLVQTLIEQVIRQVHKLAGARVVELARVGVDGPVEADHEVGNGAVMECPSKSDKTLR
jgi:hypothetical protein